MDGTGGEGAGTGDGQGQSSPTFAGQPVNGQPAAGLSLPGYVAYVTRREKVWLEAQNRHGRAIRSMGAGLLVARGWIMLQWLQLPKQNLIRESKEENL